MRERLEFSSQTAQTTPWFHCGPEYQGVEWVSFSGLWIKANKRTKWTPAKKTKQNHGLCPPHRVRSFLAWSFVPKIHHVCSNRNLFTALSDVPTKTNAGSCASTNLKSLWDDGDGVCFINEQVDTNEITSKKHTSIQIFCARRSNSIDWGGL